jgi:hypothetical protein
MLGMLVVIGRHQCAELRMKWHGCSIGDGAYFIFAALLQTFHSVIPDEA